MKSNILILFCCFLFLASCQASIIEEYTLLPHPVDIKYIPGMVKLKTQPTLVYPGELANEALLLQWYLSSDFSVQATLKKNKKKGDIILQLDPAVLPEQAEGYILDATSGNIVLKALRIIPFSHGVLSCWTKDAILKGRRSFLICWMRWRH